MGTIQKRDDNAGKTTYQARVRKKGFPSLSKNFPTKQDAAQWIAEREADMSRGVFTDLRAAGDWTFKQIMERYRDEITSKKRSAEVETIRLNALMRDKIAEYSIANLTPRVIADWRDRRLADGKAGATVNRDLNTMHHMLEIARKEWGIGMPVNVVGEVSRAKEAAGRDRRLMAGEEDAIMDACAKARNNYLAPIVTLALETAMRQSEIIGLEWQFVDMKKRVARLLITKNGDSRTVPLSGKAIEVLESLPAERDASGERVGLVFPALTREAVKRAFIRVCERKGIKDFHFHDLRHEATSRLFEKGFNPMEVSSITGHKTLSMLKRYTHLSAEDLAKRL